MAMRYLLDTNTCCYIIKGNRPRVRERLVRVQMFEVGISSVTEAELRFGVARLPLAKKLKTAIEEFFLRVEILPWDSEAAKSYADLRAAVEREGKPIGNLDLMIGAHAMAAGATLITSDAVFQRVKGLKTEDWAR